MGTLGGHLLPGAFFMIFAIWWSFVTSIRYIQSKLRSPFKKNQLIGYRTTVTMPCICLPCGKLKRAPIESYLKAIFGTIGLLGELITGLKFNYVSDINKDDATLFGCGESSNGHNHKRDTHSMMSTQMPPMPNHNLPEIRIEAVHFEYVNAQHITMYSAFVFGSIVEILIYHRVEVPARLDYIFGIMAYTIEGFLFAFHLHSRAPLDIHLHVLLVYSIGGCVICSALEFYNPHQILFTYGRILFTMLQGTWFWQVGFILYPPIDSPMLKWDRCDHNQIMTVTMSYCWHVILISASLLIQIWIMKRFYYSSKLIRDQWDELSIIDDELYTNTLINTNVYISNDMQNGVETKFLSLNSEDEDSVDERVEYDTAKLVNNSDSKSSSIKMNHFSNGKVANGKNQSSSSSTTSGNFSINNS